MSNVSHGAVHLVPLLSHINFRKLPFEMANTGGSESDVKVGSEMWGGKMAVWLLCQLIFRACPLQRFQALGSSLFYVILVSSVQLS